MNMARLIPAEQIEQSYDLTMIALADARARRSGHHRPANQHSPSRDAITEVLVDERVRSRPRSDVPG
ncbi:hypothetical protein [Bradyrhizobium cosmicum]|uniref:hypothetical protein n=1 Tax=Bradyrhizobium cosmicum TaxID=1404864 RepID=UPI0028E5EF9A|nr:hypothetical protein [Bradyrhizobium cosmicum]